MVPRILNVVNLYGGPGCGKAQPLYSKVLTTNGWKEIGSLIIGEEIVTPTGNISKIIDITPQGNKDVYELEFHDGAKTQACEDHLWLCWYVDPYHIPGTRSYNKRSSSKLITTKQIEILAQRPCRGDFKFNVSIPLIEFNAITNNSISLPIDPYIMGCLIGDGSFCGLTPVFTTADIFIAEEFNKCLSENYSLKKGQTSDYDYYLSQIIRNRKEKTPNIYTQRLRELQLHGCRSYEKFIPSVYLNGSSEQKLNLLQGLMDTDGTVDKKGHISFTTTSYQLAKDVQYLFWSFGCLCSISKRHPIFTDKNDIKVNGRVAYDVRINGPDKSMFFRLPRKKNRVIGTNKVSLRRRIKNVRYVSNQPVRCISIDDPSGLYITDDFIVTHNSTVAAGLFYKFKLHHYETELVTEFAKDLVYDGQAHIVRERKNQLMILENQIRREQRLVGHVDWAITDSPMLFPLVYVHDEDPDRDVVISRVKDYLNNPMIKRFDFFLNRPNTYQEYGRVQTLEQAKDIDNRIIKALHDNDICYHAVDVNDNTVEWIFACVVGPIPQYIPGMMIC